MDLTISRPLLDEMIGRANACPDVEICGLLLGCGTLVEALLPAPNVAPDPRDSFELDPGVLIAAHRAARGGAAKPIGHYHSHPIGAAIPSARDIAAASPGDFWIIIAGGDARCWYARAGGGFDPVSMIAGDNR